MSNPLKNKLAMASSILATLICVFFFYIGYEGLIGASFRPIILTFFAYVLLLSALGTIANIIDGTHSFKHYSFVQGIAIGGLAPIVFVFPFVVVSPVFIAGAMTLPIVLLHLAALIMINLKVFEDPIFKNAIKKMIVSYLIVGVLGILALAILAIVL